VTRDILVWGRGARIAGAYSRDRVVYRLLAQLGVNLGVFSPRVSVLGDIEAKWRWRGRADLVWVPCFRQRDLAAASRFAHRRKIPLVFDPLISAYDKQVNERGKFAADSRAGRELLDRERKLFALPDLVMADTSGHADYFHQVLGVPEERLLVLPVGADESVFKPEPTRSITDDHRVRVLFYGSYIGLHGVPTITAALQAYSGPPIRCHFIGVGPARAEAEMALGPASGLDGSRVDVTFEGWLDIQALQARIGDADIVLGIFGTTSKAQRVVPNKVYQALAMGRPVITADSPAYDASFRSDGTEPLAFTPPGDAATLAATLESWVADRQSLAARSLAASELFTASFSEARLGAQLQAGLESRGLGPFPGPGRTP